MSVPSCRQKRALRVLKRLKVWREKVWQSKSLTHRLGRLGLPRDSRPGIVALPGEGRGGGKANINWRIILSGQNVRAHSNLHNRFFQRIYNHLPRYLIQENVKQFGPRLGFGLCYRKFYRTVSWQFEEYHANIIRNNLQKVRENSPVEFPSRISSMKLRRYSLDILLAVMSPAKLS